MNSVFFHGIFKCVTTSANSLLMDPAGLISSHQDSTILQQHSPISRYSSTRPWAFMGCRFQSLSHWGSCSLRSTLFCSPTRLIFRRDHQFCNSLNTIINPFYSNHGNYFGIVNNTFMLVMTFFVLILDFSFFLFCWPYLLDVRWLKSSFIKKINTTLALSHFPFISVQA